MSGSAAPLLRFDNLTLGYDRHPAVHHLSGEIAAGSLLAVVGPNGAGKSTLLKGITGELRPLQGKVELCGLERHQIGYLTQQSTFDASFPMAIYDFVAMGLWREFGAFRRLDRAAHRRIEEAIGAVGLAGLEKRALGALSGGQMQRMLFARVLLQDADVIVLDEPFNAIDAKTTMDLIALVQRWHGEGRTVLAALHDMEMVRAHFPQTLLLARGAVAWGKTADVLTSDNLSEARRMCEAFDDTAGTCAVDHAPSQAA